MSENKTGLEARLRDMRALSLVMSAEEAAELVKDGMTVGVSGFTPSGYPKACLLYTSVLHSLQENWIHQWRRFQKSCL